MVQKVQDPERRAVALGVQKYGAAFLPAYNRQRPYASWPVAISAAMQECGAQPHERERRRRQVERAGRAIAHEERRLGAAEFRREMGLPPASSWRCHQSVPLIGAHTTPRPRGAGRPRAAATRSSARSGDSGEDGLGDSPPPLELNLERHPRYGLVNPNLLHVLKSVAR